MDSTNLILDLLKQKGVLTPLEQDILDTYHELNKQPFERDSAIWQSQKNNINHPDIFEEIATEPTTVLKPWALASDEDIYSNLRNQLRVLIERELVAHMNTLNFR